MNVILIRHGKTKGNEEKRYIGSTDEGLSEKGKNEIRERIYPDAEMIVTSSMKRCIETAEIIYGKREFVICSELRECDFGKFENKNYEELKNDKEYINWIKNKGKSGFPEGENFEEFYDRCFNCFKSIIADNSDKKSIAFVVHGGTIMAVMSRLYNDDFYKFQLGNGEFISTEL